MSSSNAMKDNPSIFLKQWKDDMTRVVKNSYRDKRLSDKKIDKLLNKIIEKRIKNPSLVIVNNYTNKTAKSDILSLIDIIENNKLIISGGGCLFFPHGYKRNVLVEFIIYTMDQRSLAKKERKKYPKGSFEWIMWDIRQNNIKLVINSLYGVCGYPRSLIFNIFIAEAVTNQGRHIITSSIGMFETFLGDAVPFTTSGELFNYIKNILMEYKRNDYDNAIDLSIFEFDSNIYENCIQRLYKKCEFAHDEKILKYQISNIVYSLSEKEVAVLYYKNNLEEFNEQKIIRNSMKYVLDNNEKPLLFCDMNLLKDDSIRNCVDNIQYLYNIFVLYDYPMFDRVRKAMYLDKSKSLYTDTDSVFVSVYSLVQYTKSLVPNIDNYYMSKTDVEFTGANLMFIFINNVVDKALKTLCYSTNVEREWAKRLTMKNEFFFARIVFMSTKKRYIALAMLQEGSLLNDGKGLSELKGLDFKKSTTKPYLRDYYTDITMEDILRADKIKPHEIFRKMIKLKNDIETGIRSGDRKFFKQSSVKLVDYYKTPYSTPGVVATILWNSLCPQYAIELPNDIDLVPVIDLTFKKPAKNADGTTKVSTKTPLDYKNIAKFAEEYPEAYERLKNDVYLNYNPNIRHMTLKYIGLPRNNDVEIPDYIYSIIDYNKIVNDALSLFLPVLKSIGLNSLPVSTTQERMSNIIEL